MESEDVRRRPVVLQTGGNDPQTPRRPYFAWIGSGLLGLAAAAGLIFGATAIWSAFDPGTPGRSPAPLWFPPPETIQPQGDTVTPTPTPTPDDHGGDRTRTPDKPRTTTPSPDDDRTTTRTTEPGDDKGGDRPRTTDRDDDRDDKGGDNSGKSTEDSSGKSTEDNSGHG